MYERNKHGNIEFSYIDAKGVELVRRDGCQIAKKLQVDVLDALMHKIDRELAVQQVHIYMNKIVNNEFPLVDYKMSKSRRKTYVNEELPHLKVVEKMRQRDPGSEPQIGDRVPFVLIETKDPKAKACEKAEDPKYVELSHKNPNTKKHIKIDRLYYVEHQIVNPVTGLLDLVIPNPKSLFESYIRKLKNEQNCQSTIFGFLKRKESPIKLEDSLSNDTSLMKNENVSQVIKQPRNDISQSSREANKESNNTICNMENNTNECSQESSSLTSLTDSSHKVDDFKAEHREKVDHDLSDFENAMMSMSTQRPITKAKKPRKKK